MQSSSRKTSQSKNIIAILCGLIVGGKKILFLKKKIFILNNWQITLRGRDFFFVNPSFILKIKIKSLPLKITCQLVDKILKKKIFLR